MNAKVLGVDVPEGAVAPWVREHLAGGGKPFLASEQIAKLEAAGWRCTGFTADGADTGRMEITIVMVRDQADIQGAGQ